MGQRPAGSPWGQQAAAPGGYHQAGAYQQHPGQPQRAGGGFMKTAMATAAGVAGGMLVAGAIGNMMSRGGAAQAAGASTQGGGTGAGEPSPYEIAHGGNDTQYQDPDANDPGTYEEQQGAADDGGGGWFGGGGDGGGDSEF
jgi:hypothetical protein